MKISQGTAGRLSLVAALVTLTACGEASNDVSATKIVGGTPVPTGLQDARRWSTVALTTDAELHAGQPSTIDQNHSFCSGTIVGRRAILTAAHCIQKFDETTRQKLPDHILPKDSDFIASFDVQVSKSGTQARGFKAIPHPDWDPGQTLSPQPTSAPNDIGLLILSDDIPDSARVAEIGNPNDALPSSVDLVGFGVTQSRDNNDTGIMRQVNTSMTGEAGAVKRFGVGSFGRGACAGDSGGPAYVQKNGKYVVVGATSTGAEIFGQCLGLMNNYTDARYYKEWIDRTIADNGG